MDEEAGQRLLKVLNSRNSGSMSDFEAAPQIFSLAPSSHTLRLQFARDFSAEWLRRDSVILIGSTRSNPWVQPFEDRLLYHLRTSDNGRIIEVLVARLVSVRAG